MSLPSSSGGPPPSWRRSRASSAAANSQNLLGPGRIGGAAHGGFNARSPPVSRSVEYAVPIGMAASPSTAFSHRGPTRSFFQSSYRGDPTPHDSAQHARDVREDTAELALYALSEQSRSVRSASPRRRSSTPSNAGSASGEWEDEDDEGFMPHFSYAPSKPSIIEEVSEPATPQHEVQPYRSPGTSVIADMLRKARPKRSPIGREIDRRQDDTTESSDDEDSLASEQRKINAPDGDETTEDTPLLRQVSQGQHHRPNYLSGRHDLEAQPIRRAKTWPKVNKVLSKQLRKGRRAVRLIASPKKWDKQAIWHNSVVVPAGYFPAVVLGALLNVLDALS